ncbi:glycoprotein endo-alpha-1,2-mannosidase isoform X2 [Brachionichthys hirsutus]|uniref:glycoprotein endo-alpha-1,2-mannosidase isoform X2 n=1 Tax=Brachionichthys hirsutus TaxID=412623 RepID=UPI0036044E34
MARFRRKSCVPLIALVMLVLIMTVVLKVLIPEDSPFGGPFGVEPFTERKNTIQGENKNKPDQIQMNSSSESHEDAELAAILRRFPPPNYRLHAFYYSWYGNPKFDGEYIHWSHPQLPHWDIKVAQGYPQGKHSPPEDIGSNFYPFLGTYSSRDPVVIAGHMQQLRAAAIGVIAVSWYPPHMSDDNGEPQEDLVHLLLEMAHKYNIKVAFHIEPFKGRDVNMYSNVKYIIDKSVEQASEAHTQREHQGYPI